MFSLYNLFQTETRQFPVREYSYPVTTEWHCSGVWAKWFNP